MEKEPFESFSCTLETQQVACDLVPYHLLTRPQVFKVASLWQRKKERQALWVVVGGAPSRGSNWHHRCSQKHSSDNTSILSHWATRELQETLARKAAAKEKDAHQFLLHFIGQSRTQANEAENGREDSKQPAHPSALISVHLCSHTFF